ncbi:MAG: helix-turn-helix transcriptional regulator [Cellvibrio sp.]|uniref:helix-turn-helix domain-containing protein n=1 Tax=Cellvibrio sp. TaxID=1965322 RepID=UPI0027177AA4|nr:helix-turn-helix transcriptional regulator [Cellvibrio sp.]
MVEVALFNINDISLLFSGFLALVLACLLFFTQQQGRIKQIYWQLLALFFFLGAVRTLDTLLYWNINVRDTLSLVSANFFFLFGFVFFLQGPLLFWFTRAAIFRDFALGRRDWLHLLPAACYPFYIYQIFHRLEPEQKLQYIHDWAHVIGDPYFEGLIWVQRLMLFGYSALCAYQLHQYKHHLRAHHCALNKVDLQWLKLLVVGFFLINCWTLLTLLDTRFINLLSAEFLGEFESHFLLIYMSVLVVYLLKNSHGFSDIQIEHTIAPEPVPEEPQQQLVEKLTDFMVQSKPYLEPHITVERLAIKLNVSPKLLSCTINNQMHMNFFELIGTYRVAEAKKRLADSELRQKPISEIMKSCGFNSKSVFNQAFKKTVGVTPSHYRQQHLH